MALVNLGEERHLTGAKALYPRSALIEGTVEQVRAIQRAELEAHNASKDRDRERTRTTATGYVRPATLCGGCNAEAPLMTLRHGRLLCGDCSGDLSLVQTRREVACAACKGSGFVVLATPAAGDV